MPAKAVIEPGDLRTGAMIPIGADATPCHSLFNVAWSADGTRLVFPYGPSLLPRSTTFKPSNTCESPRWNRLVVVSALHPSSSRRWKLPTAQPHCSYQSAAFDTAGIVASEGCTIGAPATQFNNPHFGRAYLVQLNPHGRRQARVRLRMAYSAGDVADDRHNGHVLISEDEGGNLHIKYYEWVWDFNGQKLRVVGHYRTQGNTEIIAQPA